MTHKKSHPVTYAAYSPYWTRHIWRLLSVTFWWLYPRRRRCLLPHDWGLDVKRSCCSEDASRPGVASHWRDTAGQAMDRGKNRETSGIDAFLTFYAKSTVHTDRTSCHTHKRAHLHTHFLVPRLLRVSSTLRHSARTESLGFLTSIVRNSR
jgi:hypothetical protein